MIGFVGATAIGGDDDPFITKQQKMILGFPDPTRGPHFLSMEIDE